MNVTKFVQSWLPHDEILLPFYKGVFEFIDKHLNYKYLEDNENIKSKIISDPLLGYIHLTAIEVAIMDTPLFQRLRYIKQLGLAYLIFPSLGYSRFEHSLGVLGRLNQILNKLKENNYRVYEDDTIDKIIKKYETSIRLAALLHDLGHTLFSHCSERIVNNLSPDENYPNSKKISEIFTAHFQKEKLIPFAELFAIVLIGSNNFLDFLTKTQLYTHKQLKQILEWSGRFILGLPIIEDSSSVFLSQLLSSGLDVDKIDYMTREQHYSGIRLEIDLDRILSKIQVYELESNEIPKQLEYLNSLYEENSKYKILGFSKGGQFAFEEFCIARLALHVKIYLHQKVRAAECQLESYLNQLTKIDNFKLAHNWLLLPESLVRFPQLIDSVISIEPDLFADHQISNIDLSGFNKITNRELLLRAYAFGPLNNFSEGYADINISNISKPEIDNFFNQFNTHELLEKIKIECIEIFRSLNFENNFELINTIIIDLPRLINIQQGQESIYFENPPLMPIRWTIPIDKIVVYFQENRALAYVFSPKEIAHIVAIASEKIIFNSINKVFNQENIISNRIFKQTKEIKNELTDKEYYKKYPQLKGVSDYLQKADASTKIKQIYENLASFKSLNDERITLNRILTFVNQFPQELQRACLDFLQHLKVYNESLLKIELDKVLEKIGSGKKIGFAFLGGVADSGNRLVYHLRESIESYSLDEPSKIDDALINNSDCLLIFDDNVNSGLQLINIIGELLNEKDKIDIELILNEAHINPLTTERAKKRIKEMDIYFVYIVGKNKSDKQIKKHLNKFFGFDEDKIHFSINTILKDEDRLFTGSNSDFNHEKKKELRVYLEEIGEKLLRNEGKNKDKIDRCKLGYSAAEAMVLFPYNVPTMTITALWCKGNLDEDIPWFPLAERRRRSKNGKYIGED
ncbi:MAG: HD domain-containing protein [Ignavibacteriae bacterium]|nr:HD domain-containing protein [Ignavibacteriota bacterium]